MSEQGILKLFSRLVLALGVFLLLPYPCAVFFDSPAVNSAIFILSWAGSYGTLLLIYGGIGLASLKGSLGSVMPTIYMRSAPVSIGLLLLLAAVLTGRSFPDKTLALFGALLIAYSLWLMRSDRRASKNFLAP